MSDEVEEENIVARMLEVKSIVAEVVDAYRQVVDGERRYSVNYCPQCGKKLGENATLRMSRSFICGADTLLITGHKDAQDKELFCVTILPEKTRRDHE